MTSGLGRDVRGLRKTRGITLNALAQKIGRSVGFLSQVERDLSSPSIDDLRLIAAALDVPMGWFFDSNPEDERERGVIVRAGNRRALGTRDSGLVEELLSPDLGGSFEMLHCEFQPGAELKRDIMRETEEAGYVVSGALDLWIDAQRFALKAGDSFRFHHKAYRWKVVGDQPAILIWAVSPPVY
ncbi:MAG: XRE family transcriptional regulator [Ahrensia sp.]|nr:XRE family transcriptional regulator [Ahrensia sp.]